MIHTVTMILKLGNNRVVCNWYRPIPTLLITSEMLPIIAYMAQKFDRMNGACGEQNFDKLIVA